MATDTKKSFFDRFGPLAQLVSEMTGIPASVILGQAALESNYGQSTLAQRANNFFGVKAGSSWKGPTIRLYDAQEGSYSDYRVYSTPIEGLKDWAQNIISQPRYAGAKTTNPLQSITAIKAGGYATDPDYVQKVWGVITGNNLTSWDSISYEQAVPKITLYDPTAAASNKDPSNWIPNLFEQLRESFFGKTSGYGQNALDMKKAYEDALKEGYKPDANGLIQIPITDPLVAGNTFLQNMALGSIGQEVGGGSNTGTTGEESGGLNTVGHIMRVLLIIGILIVMMIAVFRMFPATAGLAKSTTKTVTGGA